MANERLPLLAERAKLYFKLEFMITYICKKRNGSWIYMYYMRCIYTTAWENCVYVTTGTQFACELRGIHTLLLAQKVSWFYLVLYIIIDFADHIFRWGFNKWSNQPSAKEHHCGASASAAGWTLHRVWNAILSFTDDVVLCQLLNSLLNI